MVKVVILLVFSIKWFPFTPWRKGLFCKVEIALFSKIVKTWNVHLRLNSIIPKSLGYVQPLFKNLWCKNRFIFPLQKFFFLSPSNLVACNVLYLFCIWGFGLRMQEQHFLGTLIYVLSIYCYLELLDASICSYLVFWESLFKRRLFMFPW